MSLNFNFDWGGWPKLGPKNLGPIGQPFLYKPWSLSLFWSKVNNNFWAIVCNLSVLNCGIFWGENKVVNFFFCFLKFWISETNNTFMAQHDLSRVFCNYWGKKVTLIRFEGVSSNHFMLFLGWFATDLTIFKAKWVWQAIK